MTLFPNDPVKVFAGSDQSLKHNCFQAFVCTRHDHNSPAKYRLLHGCHSHREPTFIVFPHIQLSLPCNRWYPLTLDFHHYNRNLQNRWGGGGGGGIQGVNKDPGIRGLIINKFGANWWRSGYHRVNQHLMVNGEISGLIHTSDTFRGPWINADPTIEELNWISYTFPKIKELNWISYTFPKIKNLNWNPIYIQGSQG